MKTVTNQNQTHSTNSIKLDRVLVVLSPDLVSPEAPKESNLITKALTLAKVTGCELEFFHVTDVESLSGGFFADDDDVRLEREKRVNEAATLVAELVLRLKTEGVSITHDTRWDAPRSDAILRKISESQPDLVMKQSREHSYVMGLVGNTDWDLIRQSPAHVWFVTDGGQDSIDQVVTAVGTTISDDEIISAADYSVFEFANFVANGFSADNVPVHAYQAPVGLNSYAAYAPELGGGAVPPLGVAREIGTAQDVRRQIAKRHGQSVVAFAKYFHIDPANVRIAGGRPHDVIAKTAVDVSADVIVMSARNLSRWQRWSKSTTAEPLLAESPCDVIFVKDDDKGGYPKTEAQTLHGDPIYDLEQAIMDPAKVFGSPNTIVHASEISVPLRNRILEIWKRDVQAEMTEEDEGGPVLATNADLLNAISLAQTEMSDAAADRAEASLP